MEIVLYVYRYENLNPVSLFAKNVCKLVNFPLKVVKSQLSWAFIGDLPVLKVNQFLYTGDRIIQVLKSIFNIDEELGIEELNRNRLVDEICLKKIHPSTLFLSSHTQSPTSNSLNLFKELKTFLTYTIKPTNHENIQFTPKDPKSALSISKKAFKTLSTILSNHPNFNKKGPKPCSTDLLVYTYLKEHIHLLESMPEVQSYMQKCSNLLEFIQNIEDFISNNTLPIKYHLDTNTLSSLSFTQNNQVALKPQDPHKEHRRFFITSAFLAFSAFIFINH